MHRLNSNLYDRCVIWLALCSLAAMPALLAVISRVMILRLEPYRSPTGRMPASGFMRRRPAPIKTSL